MSGLADLCLALPLSAGITHSSGVCWGLGSFRGLGYIVVVLHEASPSLVTWWQDRSPREGNAQGLDLELAHTHCHHILLAKPSRKFNPYSKCGEMLYLLKEGAEKSYCKGHGNRLIGAINAISQPECASITFYLPCLPGVLGQVASNPGCCANHPCICHPWTYVRIWGTQSQE